MMSSISFLRSRPPVHIGNTFTREEMENRRLRGADLLDAGASQAQTSRALDVSRTTASRWDRKRRSAGREALLKRRGTGRPPKLTPGQHEELWAIYRAEPDDAWTCYRLTDVIFERFAVSYHPDHAGRILRRMRQRMAEGAAR